MTYQDSGQYVCVASNLIGEARSAIQLKGENLSTIIFVKNDAISIERILLLLENTHTNK